VECSTVVKSARSLRRHVLRKHNLLKKRKEDEVEGIDYIGEIGIETI